MTWRYQIIKRRGTEPYYEIGEVYLDKDGGIESWTERGVGAVGDTPKEVITSLKMMLADTRNPVFEEPPDDNL